MTNIDPRSDPRRAEPVRSGYGAGLGLSWMWFVLIAVVVLGALSWGGWYGGWYGHRTVARVPAPVTTSANPAPPTAADQTGSVPAR